MGLSPSIAISQLPALRPRTPSATGNAVSVQSSMPATTDRRHSPARMIRHQFTQEHITVSYGHAPGIGFFLSVSDERLALDPDDQSQFNDLRLAVAPDCEGVYLEVQTGKHGDRRKVSVAVMKELWKRYGVNHVAMRLLDIEDPEPSQA
ncbi:hypothetical protein BDZ85DRAFT_255474 [Elsinoe ampelina]|uniref:Uncharacterized protein n=1 Tax=Elsinoe ampelina TaxID=302913 RepID=A0A6A6GS15_9PEZI|nr:hypothetical protein BDZ85DRAFT_255474 [Elsinoe ampelina]